MEHPFREPAGSQKPPPAIAPLQIGTPALDAFPWPVWRDLIAHAASTQVHGAAREAAGLSNLREEIARYMARAKRVHCSPEQIFVAAGYQGALTLVVRTLVGAGEALWVEDPGYFRVHQALPLLGANVVPIPVDDRGLDVAAATRCHRDAKCAVVTATHHAPLGLPLAPNRRTQLLDWAESTDAWILEDDYDSEFYYGEPPPAPLKALAPDRVILFGTFSKSILPNLRVGFAVVPPALTGRVLQTAILTQSAPDPLIQIVLAKFIGDGQFERHICAMRALYGERRAALAAAFETELAGKIELTIPHGGLQLIVRWRGPDNDQDLAQKARGRGLAPMALSRFTIRNRLPPALIAGFTNVPVETASQIAKTLHIALADEA